MRIFGIPHPVLLWACFSITVCSVLWLALAAKNLGYANLAAGIGVASGYATYVLLRLTPDGERLFPRLRTRRTK